MKNIRTYLIFIDENDVYNYVKINCVREDLVNELIKEELIETKDEFSEVDWVIFENGDMKRCEELI
jgi:L-rhamnose mutarotase